MAQIRVPCDPIHWVRLGALEGNLVAQIRWPCDPIHWVRLGAMETTEAMPPSGDDRVSDRDTGGTNPRAVSPDPLGTTGSLGMETWKRPKHCLPLTTTTRTPVAHWVRLGAMETTEALPASDEE